MNEVTVGCIALAALLLLFFTGLELPFCMILVGFAGFTYLVNFKAATHMMAKDIYDVFVSYGYTVFPSLFLWGRSHSPRASRKSCMTAPTDFSVTSPAGSQWPRWAGLRHSRRSAARQSPRQQPSAAWPFPRWIGMATARPSPRALWQSWGRSAASFRPVSFSSSTVSSPSNR